MDTRKGAQAVAYTIEKELPGSRATVQRLGASKYQVQVRYTDAHGRPAGAMVNSHESWWTMLAVIRRASARRANGEGS